MHSNINLSSYKNSKQKIKQDKMIESLLEAKNIEIKENYSFFFSEKKKKDIVFLKSQKNLLKRSFTAFEENVTIPDNSFISKKNFNANIKTKTGLSNLERKIIELDEESNNKKTDTIKGIFF